MTFIFVWKNVVTLLTRRENTKTAVAGRVFCAKVGKFCCNKRFLQYSRFMQPNSGGLLAGFARFDVP